MTRNVEEMSYGVGLCGDIAPVSCFCVSLAGTDVWVGRHVVLWDSVTKPENDENPLLQH